MLAKELKLSFDSDVISSLRNSKFFLNTVATKKQSEIETVRTPTQSVVMFLFLMITVFSYKENNNTRLKKTDMNDLMQEAKVDDSLLEKSISNAELKPVFFPIYKLMKYPEPMYELVSSRRHKKNQEFYERN